MGNAKRARLTADQDQQAILHEEEMPERRNARKEVDKHEGKKYASLAGRQAGRQWITALFSCLIQKNILPASGVFCPI